MKIHACLIPHLIASASLGLGLTLATGTSLAADAVITPNEHLTAQGIPPIPQSIAERAAKYNDFRSRILLDWHPKQRSMLISTRSKGTTPQLHLLKKAKGELVQITDFPDPVRVARFDPRKGDYIVFEKDDGGSEANQLYRLDLGKTRGAPVLLTDPKEKHASGPFSHRGDSLILTSTQLDKTASKGGRAEVTIDLGILNPLKPAEKRKLVSLPGGGWEEFAWSPDDKQIVALNAKSINETQIAIIDVTSGEMRLVLPNPQVKLETPVHFGRPHFSTDGKSLILTSDQTGEFQQLMKIDLATLAPTVLSSNINWDVNNLLPARHGSKLAAIVNRDGLEELHLFDSQSGKELSLPKLPVGAVGRMAWRGEQELGITVNNAQSPGEVYALNLKTGKVEQWTTPHPTGIDTSQFADSEIIRWQSFDQQKISGLMTKPPKGKFSGPRPVMISIHGGPEAQAQIGFMGRNNYLLNELGIAVILPNVRGSNGFGKSFLKMDDGFKREDSVKDIGALLDWIATQPDLDSKRVMVSGGSYGGYMSLAVSTMYADRIVGSIDTVGISHFVTFLKNTESYRRDLRRVEYGDERDPKMAEFMEKIAPLNNVAKITKPLFVIQGKNDPRVPVTEAEQMVEKVKQNKTPVWYLVADNEGHGFARKPNQDYMFYAQIRFMEEYLLK